MWEYFAKINSWPDLLLATHSILRKKNKKRRPASHQSVNKLSFSVKWETCKADLVQDSPFSQVFSVLDFFLRTRLRCTWGWWWFLEAGIKSTSAKMSSIAYFRITIFESSSKFLDFWIKLLGMKFKFWYKCPLHYISWWPKTKNQITKIVFLYCCCKRRDSFFYNNSKKWTWEFDLFFWSPTDRTKLA